MQKLKSILKFVFASFLLILVAMVTYMFWGSWGRSADVKRMCEFPEGTDVREVIREGERLGFQGKKVGIVVEIEVQHEGSTEGLPRKGTKDELEKFKSGELSYAKVVVRPLGRKYCRLTVKDEKVVSRKGFALD